MPLPIRRCVDLRRRRRSREGRSDACSVRRHRVADQAVCRPTDPSPRRGRGTPACGRRRGVRLMDASTARVRIPEIGTVVHGSPEEQALERTWETGPGPIGWLSSVDHKEIGKRYLVTAFVFLLIGGVEALIMRVQLARPERDAADAGTVQPAVHHARRDDDLPVRAADAVGLLQLPLAAAARLARHGVPAPERAVVLGLPVRRRCSCTRASRSAQAPNAGWFNYVPYRVARVQPGPEHRRLRARA